MAKLYLYNIYSKDGIFLTQQWLTVNEAAEHEALGYLVKRLNPKQHYYEV